MLKEPGNGPPPSRATPECALPPPPPPHGKLGVGQELGRFWQRSRRKAIAFTLSRQTAGLAASWALVVPAVSHLDHSFPPGAWLSGATAWSLKSPVVRSSRQAVQEGMRPNQGACGLRRPLHSASLCWPGRGRAPPAGKCWAGALSPLGTPSPSRPGQCGAPLQWLMRCTRMPRASGHSGGAQRPRRPKEGGSDGQAWVLGWLTALTCNSLVAGWLELSGSWALC